MPLEFNQPNPFDAIKIHESVSRFVQTLPPDTKGGLVTVMTDKGMNAVLFKRTQIKGKDVEISAWIGKSWGAPIEEGISAKVLF